MDRDISPDETNVPRTLSTSLAQIEEIRCQVLEKDKNELRTRYGVKEGPNPMLTLRVDLFR